MAEGDIRCSRCGRPFEKEERVALISGRVMGDGYTDCYYWCGTCGVYTARLYHDVFCGEETARDSTPISKEEGDRRIASIRRCADPHDERCRCKAHQEYFGGSLD
jgi:hypothetical protein